MWIHFCEGEPATWVQPVDGIGWTGGKTTVTPISKTQSVQLTSCNFPGCQRFSSAGAAASPSPSDPESESIPASIATGIASAALAPRFCFTMSIVAVCFPRGFDPSDSRDVGIVVHRRLQQHPSVFMSKTKPVASQNSNGTEISGTHTKAFDSTRAAHARRITTSQISLNSIQIVTATHWV
jgi:hypothetical protein